MQILRLRGRHDGRARDGEVMRGRRARRHPGRRGALVRRPALLLVRGRRAGRSSRLAARRSVGWAAGRAKKRVGRSARRREGTGGNWHRNWHRALGGVHVHNNLRGGNKRLCENGNIRYRKRGQIHELEDYAQGSSPPDEGAAVLGGPGGLPLVAGRPPRRPRSSQAATDPSERRESRRPLRLHQKGSLGGC